MTNPDAIPIGFVAVSENPKTSGVVTGPPVFVNSVAFMLTRGVVVSVFCASDLAPLSRVTMGPSWVMVSPVTGRSGAVTTAVPPPLISSGVMTFAVPALKVAREVALSTPSVALLRRRRAPAGSVFSVLVGGGFSGWTGATVLSVGGGVGWVVVWVGVVEPTMASASAAATCICTCAVLLASASPKWGLPVCRPWEASLIWLGVTFWTAPRLNPRGGGSHAHRLHGANRHGRLSLRRDGHLARDHVEIALAPRPQAPEPAAARVHWTPGGRAGPPGVPLGRHVLGDEDGPSDRSHGVRGLDLDHLSGPHQAARNGRPDLPDQQSDDGAPGSLGGHRLIQGHLGLLPDREGALPSKEEADRRAFLGRALAIWMIWPIRSTRSSLLAPV